MHKSIQRRLLALVVGVAGLVGQAQAGYTSLTFFGDSLSDTGNVASLAGGSFPSFPGAEGRFSDGPVWTEYLAAGLGMSQAAKNSNLIFNGTTVVPIGVPGGSNYAFGGARTGLGGVVAPTSGLLGQLIAWNGSVFGTGADRVADPNGLYVVVAGANDLRDTRDGNGVLTPGEVATNVVNAVARLAVSGAEHFLIASLPDLGRTPEAVALGKAAESTADTVAFNAALATLASALDANFNASSGVDLDIRWLDMFGLTERAIDDANNNGGARFGITNVTSPCITAGPFSGQYFAPDAVGNACDVALFSDDLHASGAAHRVIGAQALAAVVPEPGSMALVACALLALVSVRRKA